MKKAMYWMLALAITLALATAAACAVAPLSGKSVLMGDPAAPTVDLTATALCIAATDSGQFVMLWALQGTPTAQPTLVGLNVTATPSPLPPLPAGDQARGKALFNGEARCATCHLTDSDETFVGPSLRRIASIAGFKRPGMDAATYLRHVIINPDATINPLTKPGIMPSTFATKLTDQDMADVIAYLLTLTF